MRTFLAIELPLSIHRRLATVQRQMQATLHSASFPDCFNWVAPEKIHITLRFLGETTTQQAAQIAHDLTPLVQRQRPFFLTIEGIGAFPNFRRPNVLWLGIGGDLAILQQMQQQIETLAQRVGFAPESRAFSPHLTIARAKRQAAPASLGQAGQAMQRIAENTSAAKQTTTASTFIATQIVHLQSELRPEGARYTALGHFRLAEDNYNPTPALP